MLSVPSHEKRLAPRKFVWMNCSKISASVSFVRRRRCCWGDMRKTIARGFHPLLQPDALVAILQVHELDADRAAVRLFAARDNLAKRGDFGTRKVAGRKARVEVRFAQPEGLEREFFGRLGGQPEGIEVGEQVTAAAVHVHHGVNTTLNRGDCEHRIGCARWRQGRDRNGNGYVRSKRDRAIAVAVRVPVAVTISADRRRYEVPFRFVLRDGIEIAPPAFLDRVSIFAIAEIKLLDDCLVDSEIPIHSDSCGVLRCGAPALELRGAEGETPFGYQVSEGETSRTSPRPSLP